MRRPARNDGSSPPARRLHYTSDADPGIVRRRAGRGFSYRGVDGRPVAASVRRWIEGLAIPPAWRDVWISADPDGHLLATGRDARGRKQYRYHEAFRSRKDAAKFDRLGAFGRSLPRLRRQVSADLGLPGLAREKVLGAMVALLEETSIRVGNEDYARENGSFGLTTLRSRHATVTGERVRFTYRGKSGRLHRVGLHDRRLARIVRRCQELPGQRLFQYEDEAGDWRVVSSDDVNDYIRTATGGDFTAKDFRTWVGTWVAFTTLAASTANDAADGGATGDAAGRRAAKRAVTDAVAAAADRLGNTPAVARRAYVDPRVEAAFDHHALPTAIRPARSRWRKAGEPELIAILGARRRRAS